MTDSLSLVFNEFQGGIFWPPEWKPGFSLAILRCQAADFGGWCDQQKLFRCGKLDGTVQVQEKLAKEAGLLEVPCFYSDWPPGRMEKLCRIKKLCTRICSFKLKSLKTAVLIQLPEVAGWVALLQLEVWITEDFVHLYSRARTHLNILDFTRCIDVWHQHIILCDAKHRWMPRKKKAHTKTYAAVHMSRSRCWFGIFAYYASNMRKNLPRTKPWGSEQWGCWDLRGDVWRPDFHRGYIGVEVPGAGNWDQRRCGNRWNHKALTWVPSLQLILWLICTTDIIRSILFRV